MKTDKEKIEEIKKGIEQSMATARDTEWGHRALSFDEQARLSEKVREFFDSVSG